MTYAQWDVIADSYIPLLALMVFAAIAYGAVRKEYQKSVVLAATSLISLAFAYLLMFLDGQFQIWPSLGLDYSTHTSVALVLALQLADRFSSALPWVALSFIGYACLMVYQRYHTLNDIVTTGVVIGVFYFCLMMLVKLIQRKNLFHLCMSKRCR